ncbi:Cys-tRNA(Pro) deacylase [Trichococcus sp.]|uniref:Cys-tRNA(Pro) deacylase n=1 Tax=Trichococcus sp. TaxID=1985464 RepID=UPI003C799B74
MTVKNKKITKTNAMRMLDKQKCDYAVHEYAWSEDHLDALSVLEKMSQDAGAVYKTIVAVGDKTGVVVGVIPAQNELDLKAFAKVSGNKRIEMLPLKDLEATTGYIRGGCSPIGMKKAFPTYLSHHILDEKSVLVSGGKRGTQIELSPAGLMAAAHAKIEEITQEKDE